MSLANGRPYLAIPGPSVPPESVIRAMSRGSVNIYEGEVVDLTLACERDLSAVARTAAPVAIYISNGHGLWEAALANVLAPGDAVLVPATGRFGQGWAENARRLGADVRMIDFGLASPVDPEPVRDALRADTDHKIRAVLAVHVDTATGVRSDIAALRRVLDEEGHPALLMADTIASLGCDRFEMDEWGVDVLLAASQKGLMTPPGIGFLWVNDKARAVRQRLGDAVSPYWDWAPRLDPQVFYHRFGGTAPTHHLFALRAALDLIVEEGIEAVWRRHAILADAVRAACTCWGEGGPLRMNAPEGARSNAVTCLYLGQDRAERLRAWTHAQAGVTLGLGIGMAEPGSPDAGGWFRIGHMGHVNAHMVLGTLAVIEAGLAACDIPHGDGAVQAAAAVCAAR